MEGLGDVDNYEKEWLLHLKNVVSRVTVSRTIAGNQRSIPVPDPDEWSRNPVTTVHNIASLKGWPLRDGEVVKDHEMLEGTYDRGKSQNALEILESMACDCVFVYWL